MTEQDHIKAIQESALNYAQGRIDSDFARESGSLQLLAAIHKVDCLKMRVFLEKNSVK